MIETIGLHGIILMFENVHIIWNRIEGMVVMECGKVNIMYHACEIHNLSIPYIRIYILALQAEHNVIYKKTT